MKVSIITINYNDVNGLSRTLDSVSAQSYRDIEYIVIDGGSSDGSAELIKKKEQKIAYWCSEKDKGIYNAMNKGIAKATGDYVLFINSGDELYAQSTIEDLMKVVKDEDLVYSDIEVFKDANDASILRYPHSLTFRHFFTETIAHPGCLIRRVLFEKIGNYDETLKICSDWKWFTIAICRHNISTKHSGLVVAKFNLDGISSNMANVDIILKERKLTMDSEFPRFAPDYEKGMNVEFFYKNMNNSRIYKLLRKFGFFAKLAAV